MNDRIPLWLRWAAFTALFPGTIAGYLPFSLAGATARWPDSLTSPRWLGVVPLLLGVAIYLSTSWHFGAKGAGTPAPYDAPRELVVSGLHRLSRNPMYLGVISCILGEAILWRSRPVLLYLPVVWLAFHLRVLIYEEPTLRKLFGVRFDAYVATVPRWFGQRHS